MGLFLYPLFSGLLIIFTTNNISKRRISIIKNLVIEAVFYVSLTQKIKSLL